MINPFKKEVIYIKLFENKIDLKHIETGRTYKRESLQKFSNERLLIAKPSVAIAFIREVLKEVFAKSLIDPKLTVLLQPMEKIEGGISETEMMIFNDLVQQIGGKYAFIHPTQEDLSDEKVLQITKT